METQTASMMATKTRKKRASKQEANPLRRGIISFCSEKQTPVEREPTIEGTAGTTLSVSDLPKRFTAYPPLLLLPFNFAAHNARWQDFYTALTDDDRTQLFKTIAETGFAAMGISRVAINAPIAADDGPDRTKVTNCDDRGLQRTENVLRSPAGLVPVFGDWGCPRISYYGSAKPTSDDFDQAFWVSTSQHKGIVQCWAPLYTMFSRGNISEKARILGLADATGMARSPFLGLEEEELDENVTHVDVIDFYVGIGYFAFCYLHRGVRTVWGWDINPWSIEGLRRGCEINGWKCVVLKVDEEGNLEGTSTRQFAQTFSRASGEGDGNSIRCVAFLGDNKWAGQIMTAIHRELKELTAMKQGLNIRHANLGLLPTSQGSWENAVRLLLGTDASPKGGWLHVHENVDVHDIAAMEVRIVESIGQLARSPRPKVDSRSSDDDCRVSCVHVEEVKTYAPGVMHCVFDIQIKPNG